ncbi:hypothetical protein [Variovorax atrisoli]|uniref:hypothetical protein n=1 Tax=Variovorax atrisoli TaxID=3394203 RepID=UPI00037FC10D|nr:hypothetical protein [Variovorax paradoxus]
MTRTSNNVPGTAHQVAPAGTGIYVASRASVPERPMMWRGLREKGWPIISTWIDESGEGETRSYAELWQRIHAEIAASAGVLLYAEAEDFPLKGALVECGIALGMGKPVAFVLPDVALAPRSMKPIGSWVAHPNTRRFDSLADAKDWLLGHATKPSAVAAAAGQRANEFLVITAASQWACERTVNDWDEGDLMKAVASMNGDWPGCEECDHDCDEPCMPHTVADVHADVDARLAQLVYERKLIAPTGYAPPAGWKPVAIPETRRRPRTVNDELQTSFCDTLDGTRWRRLIAFRDVSAERNRQDEQWGGAANDDTHSVVDWQNCILKQTRQLASRAEHRARLVKIAALAIAAIESTDRIEASSKGGAA